MQPYIILVHDKRNNMTNCTEVIFSQRACNSILSESIYRKPNETAGILLGTVLDSNWYVIEAMDVGLDHILSANAPSYDIPYINHLLALLSRQYLFEVKILGYWGSISKGCADFSSIDKSAILSIDKTDDKGGITCLINMDTTISLTVYYKGFSLKSEKVNYKIRDHLLPKKVLKYKYEEEIRILNFNQYCQPSVIAPNSFNF